MWLNSFNKNLEIGCTQGILVLWKKFCNGESKEKTDCICVGKTWHALYRVVCASRFSIITFIIIYPCFIAIQGQLVSLPVSGSSPRFTEWWKWTKGEAVYAREETIHCDTRQGLFHRTIQSSFICHMSWFKSVDSLWCTGRIYETMGYWKNACRFWTLTSILMYDFTKIQN